MEWRDEGVLLTTRRYGEDAAIIEVFTREHGLHAGIVRGGASRRMAPALQPGAQLSVEWRARLEAHLGAFRAELIRSRAAALMSEGDALAALASVAALLTAYLPEREPHGALYAATCGLIDMLGVAPDWPEAYVGWEVMLLAELGFPLELSRCAVSGEEADLAYVSPRTGRAVTRAAAAPFKGRLLPLPAFLGGAPSNEAGRGVPAGMRLTGHFISLWVAPAFNGAVPAARARLQERLERRSV